MSLTLANEVDNHGPFGLGTARNVLGGRCALRSDGCVALDVPRRGVRIRVFVRPVPMDR